MSQHSLDLHILLNFSIYFPDIFTKIGLLCDINLWVKKNILIDLLDIVTMSDLLDTVAFVRTIWCSCMGVIQIEIMTFVLAQDDDFMPITWNYLEAAIIRVYEICIIWWLYKIICIILVFYVKYYFWMGNVAGRII